MVGSREVADTCARGIKGLTSPKHGVEHLQRRLSRAEAFNAWHEASRSSSCSHETPEASRPPGISDPVAAGAGSRASRPCRGARRRGSKTRSDAVRRLGEEGYGNRFLVF